MIRVLIIDDDPLTVAVLQEVLAGQFDVLTAASGRDGLALAQAVRPDVVLLDVVLPDMDGFEVCRAMRADADLAHTKILLISGQDSVEEKLLGYQSGAADYLVKPFEHDELLAKISVFQRMTTAGETERMKGDLIDLLAHEIRTPLSGVLAGAELLDCPGEMTESDRRELARIVMSSARRLANLNETMLTLSLARCGELRMTVTDVDLGEAVRAAVAELGAEEECSRLRLDLQGPVIVRADSRQLLNVVDALLDVALRDPNHLLEVQVSQSESEGRLVVHMPERRTEPRDESAVFRSIRRDGQAVGADLSMLLAHVVTTALDGRVRTIATARSYAVEVSLPSARVSARSGGD